MQIRAASIRYASAKKLHLKQKELSLEEEIVIIEKKTLTKKNCHTELRSKN